MASFLVFAFAVFTAFFIPGDILLKKLRLALFDRLVLGTILGIVLLAFQGVIFGYLHIRWATYFYLVAFSLFWLITNTRQKINFKGIDLVVAGTIVIGVLIQVSAVWNIDVATKNGILFCCRNVPDTIYHLALTNELTKNFPPFEPGMTGTVVHNYHYWSNLVAAELIRIFKLPLAATVYQYLAILVSLLIGGAAVVLGKTLGLGKAFTRWLIFFLYFFGDILFIFIALLGKGINLNFTMLDDASQLLTGPPRAFSIVILLGGITLLAHWLKRRDFSTGLITILVLASLVGFKIYAGIFALVGLGFLGIFFLLKKDFKMLPPLLIFLVLSAAIYLPVNQQAGGLIFVGMWRFENFIVNPAFGLTKLELARLVYLEHGNWLKVGLLELFFAAAYFIFLFGTNLLAIFQTKKSLSKFLLEINIFLISGLIVTLVIGLFFIQKTGGANTIQFVLNDYFILAIFSALACSYWLPRFKKMGILFSLIVVLLTVPRVLYEGISNFQDISRGNGYVIEQAQVGVLTKISRDSQSDAKLALDPKLINNANYLYFNFLANKSLYFAGIGVLGDHGNISKEIINSNAMIFKSFSNREAQKIINSNNIQYLICPIDGCSGLVSGKLIYNGPSVKIIKI